MSLYYANINKPGEAPPLEINEIFRDIDSRPPLQKEEAGKHYEGRHVRWAGFIHHMYARDSFVRLNIAPESDPWFGRNSICCELRLADYKWLETTKLEFAVFVEGDIESVESCTVNLVNASITPRANAILPEHPMAEIGRLIRQSQRLSSEPGDRPVDRIMRMAQARLEECVREFQAAPNVQSGIARLREIQNRLKPEEEQVTLIMDGRVVVHQLGAVEAHAKPESLWEDEEEGGKSRYPEMTVSGTLLIRVKGYGKRITAVAYENLKYPRALIVAEAHYLPK